MTNKAGAAVLLTAMAFGSVTAFRTAHDVMRGEPIPTVLPDHRLDEMPEFIELSVTSGTRPEGRFTERDILTAGGLYCQVTTYASNAYAPSTCEVNQPVPTERFASLTAPFVPSSPFTTTESDTL